MRNFVAKNDYNRAAAHKSAKDYRRIPKHELMDADLDELGLIYCDMLEEHLIEIEQPPKEVSKWDNPSRNHLKDKIMQDLNTRIIGVLDIETGGTPSDCASTNILMPTFAFVLIGEFLTEPLIVAGRLNCREQLANGATVSAKTLAFWMQEALNGSYAAETFQKTLATDADMATITVVNPLLQGETVALSHNFLSNADAFQEVNNVIEGYIEQAGEARKDVRFYGNGPQFDMSIYETVSAQSNVFGTKRAIVPWQFWDVGSARNPKDYYNAMGGDHKVLEEDAAEWADSIIDSYGLAAHGVTATKHDPVFDALVEAYCIKRVEMILKI